MVQVERLIALKNELKADGIDDVRFVVFHQKLNDEFAYKIRAGLDADVPLFLDTEAADVWGQITGARGDMYIYGGDGNLALYLQARRADYDFNEPDGYARFKADILSARGN